MKPYTDIEVTDKYIIREFNENIDPIELMWHRDLENRTVEVLEGEGWQFQRDKKTDKTKALYWSCRLPRYAKLLGLKSSFSGF